MYKVNDVRLICERFYGRAIADSTWRKWRNKLGIGAEETTNGYKQRRELTSRESTSLAAYAYMKRRNPQAKYKLLDVLQELKTNPELNDQLVSIAMAFTSVKGDKLPQVIEAFTGRKTSLRTIYRIAEKLNIDFSINTNYPKDTVEKFLAYFEVS